MIKVKTNRATTWVNESICVTKCLKSEILILEISKELGPLTIAIDSSYRLITTLRREVINGAQKLSKVLLVLQFTQHGMAGFKTVKSIRQDSQISIFPVILHPIYSLIYVCVCSQVPHICIHSLSSRQISTQTNTDSSFTTRNKTIPSAAVNKSSKCVPKLPCIADKNKFLNVNIPVINLFGFLRKFGKQRQKCNYLGPNNGASMWRFNV